MLSREKTTYSSQPPLKCFRLLAQDMMEHFSAAAVIVPNTVDTDLIAYFADCKNYSENSQLKFWVTNANKYPLLAPLVQDLLLAPATEAHVERVFSICGELTAGKRNWLTKSLEKRIMLNTHTHTQPFYGSVEFVRDNPCEPVSEETFTHSRSSWSSIIPICFLHLLRTVASSLFNYSYCFSAETNLKYYA